MVYLAERKGGEALPHLEQAFEVWRDNVGEEHPSVATLRLLRADALLGLDRPREALRLIERGRRDLEATVPEINPERARVQLLLGRAHLALDQLDASADAFQRALPLLEQVYGANHQALARGLLAASELDVQREDYVSALKKCSRAQKILAVALPEDHPEQTTVSEALVAIERARDTTK